MRDNRKYGLLVMSAWLIFAVSLISGYAAYHDVPVLEYFLDEETGGFISACFFTAWALIWYFIGSHARKGYVARLKVYRDKYPSVDENELNRLFRVSYFARAAKTLTVVFSTAVPWWLVLNAGDGLDVKDYVVVAVSAVLALVCYWYYRAHNEDIS